MPVFTFSHKAISEITDMITIATTQMHKHANVTCPINVVKVNVNNNYRLTAWCTMKPLMNDDAAVSSPNYKIFYCALFMARVRVCKCMEQLARQDYTICMAAKIYKSKL